MKTTQGQPIDSSDSKLIALGVPKTAIDRLHPPLQEKPVWNPATFQFEPVKTKQP